MGENMNEKLKKILSGMGSDKLKNSADMVSKFLSTKEGQKLKDSLSDADKKAIAATYELAVVLSDIEKLTREKEKSIKKLAYLEKKLTEKE